MRRINHCLNKQLFAICQKAMQLDALTVLVRKYLPGYCADYCRVANFNKGKLVLATTDATWATQLRYAIPELREKLRKEAGLHQLTSISLIITAETTQLT